MQYKNLKHITPIQIRFVDIDKLGHVNNAVYLSYFETARVDYFNTVLRKENDWEKTGLIIARTEIDYAKPVFLEDEIKVYTGITRIGTKSFDMTNYLLKKDGENWIECVFAKSVLVCVNYQNHQTIEIPELWKTNINNFEPNK